MIDAAERGGLFADQWTVDGNETSTSYITIEDALQWPHLRPAEDDEVSDGDLVGSYRASDILDDPSLSASRKKALLAYWASDVHAVIGVPALRCARGATVTIDASSTPWPQLDDEFDQAAMVSNAPGSGATAPGAEQSVAECVSRQT